MVLQLVEDINQLQIQVTDLISFTSFLINFSIWEKGKSRRTGR